DVSYEATTQVHGLPVNSLDSETYDLLAEGSAIQSFGEEGVEEENERSPCEPGCPPSRPPSRKCRHGRGRESQPDEEGDCEDCSDHSQHDDHYSRVDEYRKYSPRPVILDTTDVSQRLKARRRLHPNTALSGDAGRCAYGRVSFGCSQ